MNIPRDWTFFDDVTGYMYKITFWLNNYTSVDFVIRFDISKPDIKLDELYEEARLAAFHRFKVNIKKWTFKDNTRQGSINNRYEKMLRWRRR